MHCALVISGTSNTSGFTASYAALPPSSTPWLQKPAGILAQNFFEPNYYPSLASPNQGIAQGLSPASINGVAWAAPYTGVGVGKPLSVVVHGITFVYLAGNGTVAAGDLLFTADQYGRVDNATNLSIATNVNAYAIGYAQQAAAATANLIIPILVQIVPYGT